MAGIVAPADNFEPAGETIAADGWFPAIESKAIRDTIRLGDGVVTDARLKSAIEGAMLSAFRALATWRTARVMEGAADLAGVTTMEVNGTNQAELIWQRIIRFYTAAELADLHIDVTATDEALDRSEEKQESADHYRRLAYHAVADMMAIGATEGQTVQRNRIVLL